MPATDTDVKPPHATETKRLWRARRIDIYENDPKRLERLLELRSHSKRWGPGSVLSSMLQIGGCPEDMVGKFKGHDTKRGRKTYANDMKRQAALKKSQG